MYVQVISQGLHSLYKIGTLHQIALAVLAKIIDMAKLQLKSASHNIQRYALMVLGGFSDTSDQLTLDLIGKYTDSQDSRVRAQAFRSMMLLGTRGVALGPSLYPRTVQSLKDDYECVRMEALNFVYELGVRNPDQ